MRLSPLLYLCRRLCGHFTAHGVLRDGRLSRPVSLSGLGVSIFCSLKEKRTGGGDQKVILQSVDGFSLSLSGALRRVIFSAAEDRGRSAPSRQCDSLAQLAYKRNDVWQLSGNVVV